MDANTQKVLLLVAVFFVVVFLYKYNSSKTIVGMTVGASGNTLGGDPVGIFSSPAPADGLQTSGNNARVRDSPESLLPKDTNSGWSTNVSGDGALKNVTLLNPNQIIGINTVGNTLKNANLQVRSEPVNPRSNTGPWNQSTIEADPYRPCLEIGCPSS
jgi:hypothetical protein